MSVALSVWRLTVGVGDAQNPNEGDPMPSVAKSMLDTHPGTIDVDLEDLARCVDACYACAEACTACADACLGEDAVAELVRCIRLDQDCADLCVATGRVVGRRTASDAVVARAALQACAQACASCAEECERHADHHEHCRICAESCRACEQACRQLLGALA